MLSNDPLNLGDEIQLRSAADDGYHPRPSPSPSVQTLYFCGRRGTFPRGDSLSHVVLLPELLGTRTLLILTIIIIVTLIIQPLFKLPTFSLHLTDQATMSNGISKTYL